MSVLVVWRNIVNKRVKSVYMAADSRFTFGVHLFDHGKKVFACKNDASLFGYCGSVEYATYIIQSLVDLIEAGILYKRTDSCQTRVQIVSSKMHELWEDMNGIITQRPINIIYCTVTEPSKECQIYEIDITKRGAYNILNFDDIKSVNSTDYIQYCIKGSGKNAFDIKYSAYKGKHNILQNEYGYITSRVMFQILCQIISAAGHADSYGGVPQLAYIYNNKRSRTKLCGVIFNNECYLGGCSVEIAEDNEHARTLKWFNENFELCDPLTKQRKEGAQMQPYI